VVDDKARSYAYLTGYTTYFQQLYAYEGGLDRVKQLDHFVGTSAPPSFSTYIYEYDLQNQIRSVTGPTSGPRQYAGTFSYSPGGRLLAADVTADASSPLAPTRDVTHDYSGPSDPEAVDVLRNPDSSPYAEYFYDESGSIVSRTLGTDTWNFLYDGNDQQRKVTNPDGTSETYYYDQDGARILALKRDASEVPVELRFWFGGTEIRYNGQGNVNQTLAHAGLDQPELRIRNKTEVEHTIHDQRGNLIVASGKNFFGWQPVLAGFTYGPFGEVLAATGIPQNFLRRFNGKEFDETSGLSYYGARYYDVLALGWTQADPLYRFLPEFAGDQPRRANLYSFSLNNPLTYWDPDGSDPESGGTVEAVLDMQVAIVGAHLVANMPGSLQAARATILTVAMAYDARNASEYRFGRLEGAYAQTDAIGPNDSGGEKIRGYV
jgi:RHS repeat-associated protein